MDVSSASPLPRFPEARCLRLASDAPPAPRVSAISVMPIPVAQICASATSSIANRRCGSQRRLRRCAIGQLTEVPPALRKQPNSTITHGPGEYVAVSLSCARRASLRQAIALPEPLHCDERRLRLRRHPSTRCHMRATSSQSTVATIYICALILRAGQRQPSIEPLCLVKFAIGASFK